MSTRPPPSGLALIVTFAALVVLAAASWVLSSVGGTGTLVALAIAAAKAILIALFFMELIAGDPTDRTIAAVAVLFVVLLCVGSLADTAYR
jgi:caa(3)-type oxidase subunit IV